MKRFQKVTVIFALICCAFTLPHKAHAASLIEYALLMFRPTGGQVANQNVTTACGAFQQFALKPTDTTEVRQRKEIRIAALQSKINEAYGFAGPLVYQIVNNAFVPLIEACDRRNSVDLLGIEQALSDGQMACYYYPFVEYDPASIKTDNDARDYLLTVFADLKREINPYSAAQLAITIARTNFPALRSQAVANNSCAIW